MSARVEPLVLLAFGLAAVRVGLGNDLAVYLRPETRWAVLTAGGAILLVAGSGLWRFTPHPGTSRGWVLLAPVLVVTVIAPPPLGALSANRLPAVPPSHDGPFPPLPAQGVVSMTVGDVVLRSLYGQGRTLQGRSIRIVGFVARADAHGFTLARLVITCCAADARPLDVEVVSPLPTPARNTWVSVTGRYAGSSTTNRLVPVVRASRVDAVAVPAHPYE